MHWFKSISYRPVTSIVDGMTSFGRVVPSINNKEVNDGQSNKKTINIAYFNTSAVSAGSTESSGYESIHITDTGKNVAKIMDEERSKRWN